MLGLNFLKSGLDLIAKYDSPLISGVEMITEQECRCQAKFLTSHHVRMRRVIFYIPNRLIKLIIRA